MKAKKIQAEAPNTTASKVTHVIHPVDQARKASLASYLIGSLNWKQVLIFTRTKQSADALSKEMELDGIKNLVIHGEKVRDRETRLYPSLKKVKLELL